MDFPEPCHRGLSAPRPRRVASAGTVEVAVTHRTEAVEFVDVLVSDDDWVRDEFDAIVAAGWGPGVPPRPPPPQGGPRPRRPGYVVRPPPVRVPRDLLIGRATVARQRGPPA